VNKRLQQEIFA